MANVGDYGYEDPNYGYGMPPAGYHWDENGNLVSDSGGTNSTTAAPTAPSGPADAYQGFQSQWAPGASAPSNAPAGAHWDPNLAMYVADAPGTPGTGDGGGGGLGSSVGSLIAPYVGGSTAPATPYGTGYLPQTPEFHAPGYTPPPAFDYSPFQAPTGETVLNEPGFKFGLDTGLQGLQQSAAARGVLNGGGTLKDIAAWANNYGSQKYGDAYSREANTYGMNRANALGNYNTNYQTQFVDPYQFAFQGAQAEFAPKMQGYATQAAAGQRANEFAYNADFAKYQDEFNRYMASQNLLYNYRRPFLEG